MLFVMTFAFEAQYAGITFYRFIKLVGSQHWRHILKLHISSPCVCKCCTTLHIYSVRVCPPSTSMTEPWQ